MNMKEILQENYKSFSHFQGPYEPIVHGTFGNQLELLYMPEMVAIEIIKDLFAKIMAGEHSLINSDTWIDDYKKQIHSPADHYEIKPTVPDSLDPEK
ncbi:17401_t:CDS:2 [Gigaspora margarita]|uniref:17401_t:CDS:1 n=1 Tax=Gigaspora margarita TaxID=4874 RepID=A0ABN7VYV8_GIGMA|nr:17401_t:CDS:2 [Gigaspora margarita]